MPKTKSTAVTHAKYTPVVEVKKKASSAVDRRKTANTVAGKKCELCDEKDMSDLLLGACSVCASQHKTCRKCEDEFHPLHHGLESDDGDVPDLCPDCLGEEDT